MKEEVWAPRLEDLNYCELQQEHGNGGSLVGERNEVERREK